MRWWYSNSLAILYILVVLDVKPTSLWQDLITEFLQNYMIYHYDNTYLLWGVGPS